MDFKRLWAIFKARNYEFFRDRSALGWNFIFPFLLVAGFSIIFGGEGKSEYKVGLFPVMETAVTPDEAQLPEDFHQVKHIEFIPFSSFEKGIEKLKHHKIDFLLELADPPHRYWISSSSPRGYIVEKVFQAGLVPPLALTRTIKQEIKGREIMYIDWLFPGILAMNMMFSALWGVGYIVVRYRKNGVLKRLKATPLTSFEFLCAQTLSRIFLLMFTLVVVWIGCDLVFSFAVEGSYATLFFVFFLGGISVTSLGLLIAARGTSEEFTSGILNFITWPMMFLSEVWFSLEGAPHWLKILAKVFPLTHMLTAARQVMNDGAGILTIMPEIITLTVMTSLFLSMGAALFSWSR
jgi:ABC-2 type transport system permease protein